MARRALIKRPGFSMTAIATLAATIGTLTLLFSVIRGVLLKPLPYDDPGSLVSVHVVNHPLRESTGAFRSSWDRWPLTMTQVDAWRNAGGPIASLGAFQTWGRLTVRVGDREESFAGARIDEGVFETLGVAPALGRFPTAEESARSEPLAVVHHRLWREMFGGSPDVIGQTLQLEDVTYTVVGVMPRDFIFPDEGHMLWTTVPGYMLEASWFSPVFTGVARLAPGATAEDASQALDAVAVRLGENDPEMAGLGARTADYRAELLRGIRSGMNLLLGTTVLVLLMACVNLANGVLARGLERRRELAVRAALGQGRQALVLTALVEVGVLAAIGGGAGFLLAAGLLPTFVGALDSTLGGIPRSESIALDLQVFGFTLLITTLTALGAGLVPAISAARRAPGDTISTSRGSSTGRGVARSQRLMLGIQATLVMVLMTGTGLLVRSFVQMTSVDPGYATEGVAWARVEVAEGGQDGLDGGVESVPLTELLERVRSIPGIVAASAAELVPGTGGIEMVPARATVEDPMDAGSLSGTGSVESAYFSTLEIDLVRGESFTAGSTSTDASAAIIDEMMAERLFGDADPVGRPFITGTDDHPVELTVVGVMASTRQLSPILEPLPQFLRPMVASPGLTFHFVARTEGDADQILPLLREAVAHPQLSVLQVGTLEHTLAAALTPARLRLGLVSGLAGMALLLALLGTFGVVSHQVTSAQREIGIRVALGAKRPQEALRVIRAAIVPTGIGVALGCGGALLVSRALSSVLFEVPATDPVAFVGAGALVLIAGVVASWMPARRVMQADPMTVLNGD